jgi:hypothetical protein
MDDAINMLAKHLGRSPRAVLFGGIALGFALVTFAPGSAIAVGEPIETKVAYLDPGTGSMILQAIVATIAGLAVAITSYRQKIMSFFRRRSRGSEASKTAPKDD